MTLKELLDKCINEHLIDLIISGKKKKGYKADKIKIKGSSFLHHHGAHV